MRSAVASRFRAARPTTSCSTRSISGKSIGLRTYASAAIARAFALRSADIASSGMPASNGSARCSTRNSQPSITGIIRSRTMASGGGASRSIVQRFAAVRGCRDHIALVAQHLRQRDPDARVVLDQQQADSRQKRGLAGLPHELDRGQIDRTRPRNVRFHVGPARPDPRHFPDGALPRGGVVITRAGRVCLIKDVCLFY